VIAAVGDRRKLLEAISALRGDTGVKMACADEATAPSATYREGSMALIPIYCSNESCKHFGFVSVETLPRADQTPIIESPLSDFAASRSVWMRERLSK
jgi:hypothetical protein